jgi:hypothetical protein
MGHFAGNRGPFAPNPRSSDGTIQDAYAEMAFPPREANGPGRHVFPPMTPLAAGVTHVPRSPGENFVPVGSDFSSAEDPDILLRDLNLAPGEADAEI